MIIKVSSAPSTQWCYSTKWRISSSGLTNYSLPHAKAISLMTEDFIHLFTNPQQSRGFHVRSQSLMPPGPLSLLLFNFVYLFVLKPPAIRENNNRSDRN